MVTEESAGVLDKIRVEIMDAGAYEQEVNGKTEFLKGINYCLGVIDKYKDQELRTDTLDKIRAETRTEIKTKLINAKRWEDHDYCCGVTKANRIIDKYRRKRKRKG